MRYRQTVTVVPLDRLTAHPGNVRDDLGDLTELAASIREHGVMQPLTVTELDGEEGPEARLRVLDGHRRLKAAALAHQTQLPVIIRHGVTDASEQLVVMLVTAVHRRDLSPVERAQAYGALRNHGLTLSEIGRRVGVSQHTVSRYLTLLDLDAETRQRVHDGIITAGDAIEAAIEVRQDKRQARGGAPRGRPKGGSGTAAWFNPDHRLAGEVRRICTHRTDRPMVGGTGCGPCWETAIVADATERLDEIPSKPSHRDDYHATVDEVVVDNFVAERRRDRKLTHAEAQEAYRRLRTLGHSTFEIEDIWGLNADRYEDPTP